MHRVWFILRLSRIYQWPLFSLILLYGWYASGQAMNPSVIVGTMLFSFPIQFITNGFNDIYDIDTDSINPRKKLWFMGAQLKQSQVPFVAKTVLLFEFVVIAVALVFFNLPAIILTGVGLVVSRMYSSPPFRTKERPVLCLLTYGLGYVCIVLTGYYLGYLESGLSAPYPPTQILVLALGPVGFASLSFVLDYDADKKVGLKTLATVYGKRPATLLCSLLFGIISLWFLSFGSLVVFAYLISTTLLCLLGAVINKYSFYVGTMIWMFAGAVLVLAYKLLI